MLMSAIKIPSPEISPLLQFRRRLRFHLPPLNLSLSLVNLQPLPPSIFFFSLLFLLIQAFYFQIAVICFRLGLGFRLHRQESDKKEGKMQQSPTAMPVMPSFPPTNITTEQIQKYLDENKKLILAILDNQNLGKLAECAQYQAQLQKNLMYLAAIADAQPATPSPMAPAAAPHPAMQQGAYYMHPQGAAMAQQQPGFSPKMQMQFASPHQLHQQQQQQQQQQYLHQQQQHQAMQGQLNMRAGGPGNGMHSMHSEAALGGGGHSRQSPSETGHSSDVPGSSAGEKGADEGK